MGVILDQDDTCMAIFCQLMESFDNLIVTFRTSAGEHRFTNDFDKSRLLQEEQRENYQNVKNVSY